MDKHAILPKGWHSGYDNESWESDFSASSAAFNTSTGTNTLGGDVVIAAGKDLDGETGDGAIDFSMNTGTFKTSTGAVTIGGDTTISGSKTFTSGTGNVTLGGNTTISGTKTFTSGTGNVTLGGNTTISSTKTFTTGTGTTTINGAVSFATGIGITVAGSGAGVFDFSNASGAFTTSTGTNTLSGNVVISGAGTFASGSGAFGINGAVTLAADKNITAASGTSAFDFSAGSGTFKTSTGAHTLAGDVTISGAGTFTTGTGAIAANGHLTVAATKNLILATGAGYLQVNASTSGGLAIVPGASSAYVVTLATATQTTGTATLTIPDMANTGASVVITGTAQSIGGTKTFTSDIVTTGIVCSDSSFGVTGLAATTTGGGAVAITGGGTTSGNPGAITITGGSASGAGTAGSVTIDAGSHSGGSDGAVSIAPTNASGVSIGKTITLANGAAITGVANIAMSKKLELNAAAGAASASGLLFGIGTSNDPALTSTASANFVEIRAKSTASSGDNRLAYFRYDVGGSGTWSGECGRFLAKVTGPVANVTGLSGACIFDNTSGAITGSCSGITGILQLNALGQTVGHLYGISAEVYNDGVHTGALPSTHAILRVAATGDASGAAQILNAIWFSSTANSGSGLMIYNQAGTGATEADGCIRILVDESASTPVARYLRYWDSENS